MAHSRLLTIAQPVWGGGVAVPWYLSGGVDQSVIAAWDASGAVSLAASYLKLGGLSLGNANIDPAIVGGVAPTWAAGTGWTFNGTTQYLKTGVCPNTNTNWTAMLQFTNAQAAGTAVLAGVNCAAGGYLYIWPNDGTATFRNLGLGSGGSLLNGNLTVAGLTGYNDGSPSCTLINPLGSYDGSQDVWIGGMNGNGALSYPCSGNVQKILLSNTALTSTQVSRIAAAMAGFNGKVVGFGDSITSGTGASDAAHRWLNIVATNKNWQLINSGISGTVLQNTVQNSVSTIGGPADNNGRDTYVTRVNNYYPDHVLILYGLNDLRLNDAAFTVALFQNDLGEVIDAIVANGTLASNIVIGGPSYVTAASYGNSAFPWNGGTLAKHLEYITACSAVATAKGTKFINVRQWMVDNGGDTLLDVDGIHPTDAGHAVIANAFLSVL